VERGGRGPAGRSGKTSGNEIDGTASSSDTTATSSAKSSLFRARRPAQHLRAPMLTADGDGQLDRSLAGTFFGFRGLRVEVGRCAAPEQRRPGGERQDARHRRNTPGNSALDSRAGLQIVLPPLKLKTLRLA